jgi:hypothetical protein
MDDYIDVAKQHFDLLESTENAPEDIELLTQTLESLSEALCNLKDPLSKGEAIQLIKSAESQQAFLLFHLQIYQALLEHPNTQKANEEDCALVQQQHQRVLKLLELNQAVLNTLYEIAQFTYPTINAWQ